MNTQKTFFLLSVLSALVLTGCGKEDIPQPPTTDDAAKAEPSQTALSDKSTLGAPSSSPIDPSAADQPIQQTRQRIFDEIVSLIGRPAAGLSAEHWKTIKARYWKPEFDRVVQPATKPINIQDMLAVPKGKESLIIQLWTGRFTDAKDKAEKDALLALQTMAMMTAAS